jgi:phospholipase D1/2
MSFRANDRNKMKSSSSQSITSHDDLVAELPAYQVEGDAVLLHGYLHVQIVRAKELRDFDCMIGCRKASTALRCCDNVSDPYVTVHAGDHRLIKTSVMTNRLNPHWKESFVVPISHHVEALEFRVKDSDFNGAMNLLGKTYLPIRDILKLNKEGKPRRTGIHKVVHLDGKPRHGSFEYFVEYVPAEMMKDDVAVPGTYFKPKQGNSVKLYINADDCGSERGNPEVSYGANNDLVWKPNRLWKDIFESICQAKELIYIAGWAVDYEQSFLRGEEREQALNSGKYSPYIGDLLKAKAEEGVRVNVLVWDDQTSNGFHGEGMMATKDEELREFFKGTKVNLHLASMLGGESNPYFEQIRNAMCFTHHQKMVVCDEKSELLGYVGGIDLTYGRFDNSDYSLFRTLASDHNGDFHNGCHILKSGDTVGPRQPWHDIHLCVRGPAAQDILQNFEERWRRQAISDADQLVDRAKKEIVAKSLDQDHGGVWSTQLFRSIDARTASFDPELMSHFSSPSFDEIKGVKFLNSGKKSTSHRKLRRKFWKISVEYDRRFVSDSADGFVFPRTLDQKKGRAIDHSAHDAMVYHIRRAHHTVYIESQYFLSSSHIWSEDTATKCYNLIAAELTWKICQKIEARERFAAYIVIPMWPEGVPESGSVQEILRWQRLTIESMYRRVCKAIQRQKDLARQSGSQFDMEATDYLNFYCLANRETEDGSEAQGVPRPQSIEETLSKSRRHLIYVHSKLMIVDDAVALIGSANINQRSLDGTRDSEIVQGVWQPDHLATNMSIAVGDIHGFRLHCWSHLTGKMEDIFRDPSNLDCVRRLNTIAKENWKIFSQEQVAEMNSYLVSYPIRVDADGKLSGIEGDVFPDTKAQILGSKSFLPEYLTT